MEKNLYIDASHPDETRIVLKSKNHIEEYEYENKNKLYLKNNIYLGKVARIEPSLQAAFINYGKKRHGFLAFNDILSDYYQIPHDDKYRLKKEEENLRLELKEKSTNVEEVEKNNINTSGNVENSVNTQINSGNRGYHVINHYPRADFISLNGPELRLAAHNRYDSLEGLAKKIAENLDAKYIAVTLGRQGAFLLDRKVNTTHTTPVLSTKVLDRVGAGDAFLSLSSLCLGTGMPPEIGLFVGSAAAALDVQIVCNREPISPVNLYKYITTLLK